MCKFLSGRVLFYLVLSQAYNSLISQKFCKNTSYEDLIRIRKWLFQNMNPNLACGKLHLPNPLDTVRSITSLKTQLTNISALPNFETVIFDSTGCRVPVLIHESCFDARSLGNTLALYLDAIACSLLSGVHLINVVAVNMHRHGAISDGFHLDSVFFNNLPQVLLHQYVNVTNPIESVDTHCTCSQKKMGCHEVSDAPMYRSWKQVAEMLRPPLEAQHQELQRVHGLALNRSRASLLYVPHNYSGHLPHVPEVTIHCRCGDNSIMGILPFRAFTSRIPQDAKEIYVISDGSLRFSHKNANLLCDQVLSDLYKVLSTKFPRSAVAILRGHHLMEDYVRIGLSSVSVCSASTFCIWPALANNNTVYYPKSWLIGRGSMPYLGDSFHWFTDPAPLHFHHDTEDPVTFVERLREGL